MTVTKKLIASTLLVIMNAIADMVMQQLQWEKDWLRNVFTFYFSEIQKFRIRFKIIQGKQGCRDIDECSIHVAYLHDREVNRGKQEIFYEMERGFGHKCSADSTCTNTMGSYKCACKPGFNGNGRQCSQIDECKTARVDCHFDANCVDKIGFYVCECKPGFRSDSNFAILLEFFEFYLIYSIRIFSNHIKAVLASIAKMMTNVNPVYTRVITIRIVSTIEAVIYASVKLVSRVQHVMITMNVMKIRIDVISTLIVQIQSVHINVDVNMDTKVMVLENVPILMNVVQVWFNSSI